MTLFELVKSCCGYCMHNDDGKPDCACDDDGLFDMRKMIKCCEENCRQLRLYHKSNIDPNYKGACNGTLGPDD